MDNQIYQFEVSSQEQGVGLLAFLRTKIPETFSTKAIKRAIDGKCCTINQRVEIFSSHVVSKGDKIVIRFKTKEPPFLQKNLEILYEDEDLLICNKPVGVVSEPKAFPFPPLHRLDKETTGALILAKNPAIAKKMIHLFSQKEVHKEYLALVDGLMYASSGKIDYFLKKKFGFEGQTVWGVAKPGEKGLEALTFWTCLDKQGSASLLLCIPKTGRTHQLRVHLSSIGHPILGDFQYGKQFKCSLRPQRHLLHAFRLSFTHPTTQKLVSITAPIPQDFQSALKALKMHFVV
jgi:23S rRNA pseudouridine955/2504/2580 synthase/23S rRNA pseudouridine1911/1915/1917 synthase